MLLSLHCSVLFFPSVSGQQLIFQLQTDSVKNQYINLEYYKGLSLVKDSLRSNAAGMATINLHLNNPSFVRILYKTVNKKIYVIPSATIQLILRCSKESPAVSMLWIMGDYSINQYLDSVKSNEVFSYINNRVRDVSGSIDSLACYSAKL